MKLRQQLSVSDLKKPGCCYGPIWPTDDRRVGDNLNVIVPGGVTGYALHVRPAEWRGLVSLTDLPTHPAMQAAWPYRRAVVPMTAWATQKGWVEAPRGTLLYAAAVRQAWGTGLRCRVVADGRQPVLVPEVHMLRWLIGEADEALSLLRAMPASR